MALGWKVISLGAVWTVLGLFFTAQTYLDYTYADHPIRWAQAAGIGMSEWYVWALLSPVAWLLARRLPFTRKRWWWSLLVHLPVTLVLTGLKIGVHVSIVDALGISRLRQAGMGTFNVSLLTCWMIVGAAHALYQARESRRGVERARQLEMQLSRAQLDLLRSQLQPHFLFNTLHSVSALMHRDVHAAEEMLTRLSDLLRLSLDRRDTHEVELNEELEFTRLYLSIQGIRFGERLGVQYDIAPEAVAVLVPAMILQPLVENAVRHGVEQRNSPGRLRIAAQRSGERLELVVEDDGPGIQAETGPQEGSREGIGLANIRARLEKLYASNHAFVVANVPDGGHQVKIEIPWREAPLS